MKHNGWRTISNGWRTISIVAVLAVVFAMLPIAGLPALTAGGDSWDLGNFVTGVTVRDPAGSEITDGVFRHGETYTFSINFAESMANGQFEYTTVGDSGGGESKDALLFQLPGELTVDKAVTDGEIFLGNGAVVGWYTIDKSGLVTVWFGDFDKNGNTSSGNFINYTDAGFSLEVEASFSEGVEAGTIPFGTGASIIIKDISYPDLGVMVKKSSVYSGSEETITYEVVITATGGPNDNPIRDILLTDIPFYRISSSNAHKYTLSNESREAYTSFSYNVNGGTETMIDVDWSDFSSSVDRNRFSFVFPDELKYGDKITLTYVLDLYEFFDINASGPERTKLSYNWYLGNDVTAVTQGGKTDSAVVEDHVQKKFVSKSVSTVDSTTIKWTAAAGDGTRALGGSEVVDSKSSNTPPFTDMGDITIKLYGQPSGAITALYPNGQFVETNDLIGAFNAGDAMFGTVANGDVLKFTVPEAGVANPDGGVFPEIFRVEIIYESKGIKQSGDLGLNATETYVNTIIYDGTVASASRTVSGPKPVYPATPSITKSSSGIRRDVSGDYIIDYRVEFTIPIGNAEYPYFEKEVYLYDDLSLFQGGDVVNEPQNLSVSIKGADGVLTKLNEGTGAADYTVVVSPSRTFHIYFGENDGKNYKWPYEEAVTMVVTYTIPLSAKTAAGRDIETMLREDMTRSIGNQAVVRNPTRSNFSYSGYVFDAWPIYKDGAVNSDDESVFNYKVTLNGANNGRTPLYSSEGAAVLFDTFSEELEYVPGSLYVVLKANEYNSRYWRYYAPSTGSDPGSDFTDCSVRGAISVDFAEMYRLDSWGGSVAASSGFTLPDSESTGSADYLHWFTQNSTMEVYYKLRVSDRNASEGGSVFTNTATIISNVKRGEASSCDFSSSVGLAYSKDNPLKKTMTENGTNLVEVEIIINANGRKLLDMPGMGAQFIAVDKMSANLSIYLNSIEFYTKTKVNGVWSGEWVMQAASATGDWSVKSISAQEVEFTLPDETPVRIVYKALVTRPVGEVVTVENTVAIEGYASAVGTSKTFMLKKTDSYATAGNIEVIVFKTDADDDDLHLEGAEFRLYMALQDGTIFNAGSGSGGSGSSDVINAGGLRFCEIMSVSYDSDIEAYLLNSVWITASHRGVYLLVETKSPDGYDLPEDLENYTYFVVHSPDAEEIESLEEALDARVLVTADSLHIKNVKTPAPPQPPEPPVIPETTDPPEPTEPPTPPGPTDPPKPTPPGPTEPPTTPGPTTPPESTEPPAPPGPPRPTESPGTTEPQGPETPPEPAEPPYIPGGSNPSVPPLPISPGNTLVPDGDDWVELTDGGVPYGKWEWDDDTGKWIFDEYPPLSNLPQTGVIGNMAHYLAILGLLLIGIVVVFAIRDAKKRKKRQQRK